MNILIIVIGFFLGCLLYNIIQSYCGCNVPSVAFLRKHHVLGQIESVEGQNGSDRTNAARAAAVFTEADQLRLTQLELEAEREVLARYSGAAPATDLVNLVDEPGPAKRRAPTFDSPRDIGPSVLDPTPWTFEKDIYYGPSRAGVGSAMRRTGPLFWDHDDRYIDGRAHRGQMLRYAARRAGDRQPGSPAVYPAIYYGPPHPLDRDDGHPVGPSPMKLRERRRAITGEFL